MLIDHLIYRAPDLAGAVADLVERLGVRAQAGGQHIGLGTHNALLALGPRTYLEIITPDPGQPAPSGPRPFGLDGSSRAGLVGWAIACRDIDAAVARACSRGYDPGEVAGMQRATPAGVVLRWQLTLGTAAGGLVPFLISWGDTEHPARSAPRGLILESFHLEHPHPASLVPMLTALGADAQIRPAAAPALIPPQRPERQHSAALTRIGVLSWLSKGGAPLWLGIRNVGKGDPAAVLAALADASGPTGP